MAWTYRRRPRVVLPRRQLTLASATPTPTPTPVPTFSAPSTSVLPFFLAEIDTYVPGSAQAFTPTYGWNATPWNSPTRAPVVAESTAQILASDVGYRTRAGDAAGVVPYPPLLSQAFDEWDLARVALRADSANSRSISAILRLGASAEGVLRSHRVRPDGSRGDTAYFSVLADEWPQVRAGLRDRLGLA